MLSTTCTNLERRIVVFSNPIFRWPNFLNVPKPMDSPLLCTAGRQRMTWFSSRHFHYIAIIKFWYSLSFSTVLREKCHLWHYFKSCFLFRWPVKKTGWTNQSLWLQSPRSTSMKEGDVKSATQRNCMDHYQLWTNQKCFNSSHFRETGTKQKRYDRVGKDVTSGITRVVFRESSLLEIRRIRL